MSDLGRTNEPEGITASERTWAHAPDPRPRHLDIERIIAQLAGGQHGVITRDQLVSARVPPHRVAYRVKSGRLRRIHAGVYGTGSVPTAREHLMAAVLACGPGARLSHWSGLELRDLVPPRPGAPVDVTVDHAKQRRVRGLRVHRFRDGRSDDVTYHDGIPVTSPGRTLLDIAALATESELERIVARAERMGLVTLDQLRALAQQHPRRRGMRSLRALLDRGATALTRSKAEAAFLHLVRRAGLRSPESNVVLFGFEVDFLWRAERLVVEIDGFAFHRERASFERDRRRDAELTASGLRVLRFTWRQLNDEPEGVLVRVVRALGRSEPVPVAG